MNAGKKCKNSQSEMNEGEWGMGQKTAKKRNKLKNIKITARKYPDYAICNCVSEAQRAWAIRGGAGQ